MTYLKRRHKCYSALFPSLKSNQLSWPCYICCTQAKTLSFIFSGIYKLTVCSSTCPAGSVTLESPVLPVMEGDSVTLSCRCKALLPACSLGAGFYRDGTLIGNTSTGKMTIHNVSKSDEGIYKCNVSGSEFSPESWLSVRGQEATMPIQCYIFYLVYYFVQYYWPQNKQEAIRTCWALKRGKAECGFVCGFQIVSYWEFTTKNL